MAPEADTGPVDIHPPRTVLLIDDEDSVREVCTLLLQRAGYQVVEAANGAGAIETSEALGVRVDAVICDLALPDIPGIQLVQRLRQAHDDLGVVYVSGWDSSEAGLLDERSTFLQKPFQLSDLLAALDGVAQSELRAAA